jgi:hypothetical protein
MDMDGDGGRRESRLSGQRSGTESDRNRRKFALRISRSRIQNVLDYPRATLNHCRAATRERRPLPVSFTEARPPRNAGTAERLQMKSAANVSQQLSRAKKAAKAKIQPARPAI